MAVQKKSWLDGSLPFLIKYMPIDLKKYHISSDEYKKDYKGFFSGIKLEFFTSRKEKEEKNLLGYYDSVDSEKIISDYSSSSAYYFMGAGVILLSIFMLVLGIINNNYVPFFIFFGIGLLLIAYAATVLKKYMILDREKGLITFPDWFYMKPHTIPFNQAKFLWVSRGGASGALAMKLVVTPPKSARAIDIGVHAGRLTEAWSFIVWHMDKNRPLPPGDAFDPYRERDFKRRKKEGFPAPLYKSTFITPEATPEQQAKREQYWRDEDYFGESFWRWY